VKRYKLLTDADLLKGNYYECISLWGNNPNPRRESVYYDRYGNWCVENTHTILEIIDNSVMFVLARENPKRYKEIINGGSYEDGKYNDERCENILQRCRRGI
jgi:hypothetical protein